MTKGKRRRRGGWDWNKKGSIAIYMAFIITAVIIVVITAVFAPMGVLFNTKMYAAGEDIMLRANQSIEEINDATVKAAVRSNINNAFAAQENNIAINANLFQYSWVFIIGLSALVVFLYTRRLAEIQGGGLT